ncbi:hypothetical protein OE88DRAFT_1662450 [Heliocybe sulcata]|uniref:F-box domain-containing protein n=1 Tax=Heliocybe sulcata TaxID=5364 RepID=A0A5C3MZZ4_9AGAM|nr:hypothetical protein OE88DRAFT_1662450 [Heliocybe sulcata]
MQSLTQTIPTELVSKIFVHCLDTESNFITPDPCHAPLLLTQVCASWRECAVNTTELWCSLRVRIPYRADCDDSSESSDSSDSSNPRAQRAVAHLQSWLSRAGEQPLALSLFFDASYTSELDNCVPVLRSFISQCRILSLEEGYGWLSPLLSGLHCPMLESLELVHVQQYKPLDSPLRTPSLQRLSLSGSIEWTIDSIRFPRSQLRELHWCDYSSMREILHILPQYTSLTKCRVTLAEATPDQGLASELPLLRALEIDALPERDGRKFDDFLGLFIVPSLQELRLVPVNIDVGYPFYLPSAAALTRFLVRSDCRLTELWIELWMSFARDVEQFRELLLAMPHLERLHIDGVNDDFCGKKTGFSDICDYLTYAPTGRSRQALLPQLTDLEIGRVRDHHETALERMLRSRMRATGAAEDGKVYLGRFRIVVFHITGGAGRRMEWTGPKDGEILKTIL